MPKNIQKRNAILCRTVWLLLTVVWIAFIFANSMQTGEESGEQSQSALAWILELFSSIGLPISITELFLRKLAHFLEYALLGLLFSLDLKSFGLLTQTKKIPQQLLTCLTAVPCCTLCASVDEFLIQRLTPGRGPSITDVLIDTSGALSAALIFFLARYILDKKSKAEKE